MDNTCAAENLRNKNHEIKEEPDSCVNDETVINVGCIKQEPCNTEDQPGNIRNYSDIKDEITEDPTVVVQETSSNIKGNYLTCCDECGEEYDLYCLKCPMLIRIFDSNNPNSKDNRVSRTLPKSFIDICETAAGVRVVALRAIPKGVVFGPFKGLNSSKDDTISKWKLKNKELAYMKDPKRLNWMQYIWRTDRNSCANLIPFQYENELYYRSDCHINVGDELLLCWDSDREENTIQNVEEDYWKPRVCERLDDTYACTFCCVGYKSMCHLTAHNSGCPKKRNQKDFCKEIIQCAFCKIYVDEKEYLEYHMDRCCERNTKMCVAVPCSPEDRDEPDMKDDKYKCSMCEYSTSRKDRFKQHQLTHSDLRMYKCLECPYCAGTKRCLQKHVRTHAKRRRSRFECELCGERFTRSDFFAVHQKKEHSVSIYKCDKCVFETANAQNLMRHLATHEDAKRYGCKTCGKRFSSEDVLAAHVRNYHDADKKEYKCPKCDYESFHKGTFKKHLLTVHSGVQRFKCPRCVFRTSYKSSLQLHLRYHEGAKATETGTRMAEKKEYKCCKCHYRTYRKSDLKQHVAIVHDGLRPFACTLCPHKTTTSYNLKQHVTTHNEDKPFKCDACPKAFKQKSYLVKHAQSIHSEDGEKIEYKCPQCPFGTKYKATFVHHVNAHNKSELFRCSKCDFNTYLKRTFNRHRNRHERTKTHACSLRTNDEGDLEDHLKTHDLVKPSECDELSKKMEEIDEIPAEGPKSFDCPTCGITFNFKGHLTRHIKRLHASWVKGEKSSIESDD